MNKSTLYWTAAACVYLCFTSLLLGLYGGRDWVWAMPLATAAYWVFFAFGVFSVMLLAISMVIILAMAGTWNAQFEKAYRGLLGTRIQRINAFVVGCTHIATVSLLILNDYVFLPAFFGGIVVATSILSGLLLIIMSIIRKGCDE